MHTDKHFFIRMAMAAVQGIPEEWTGCSPMVAAFLDLANHPLCAATDAHAARCLLALGGRLPGSRSPKDNLPGSVGLLLINTPMCLTQEWTKTLAEGAIIIIRGTEEPACAEKDAVNCVLDFEHGLSVGMRPGGLNHKLRQFIITCGEDKTLADSIVQMAFALQSKNAHVSLAADAIAQRDARITMLGRQNAKPLPYNDTQPSDRFANRFATGIKPRKEPQCSRLWRRVLRLTKHLSASQK